MSKYIPLMWMKYSKEYFIRFKVTCSLNKNPTFWNIKSIDLFLLYIIAINGNALNKMGNETQFE
jgi:hypothetical protein